MKLFQKMTVAAALASAAVTGVVLIQPAIAGNSAETRIETKLTGGAIGGITPEGSARFRSRATETQFRVQAEHVNLPDGTQLTVTLVRGVPPAAQVIPVGNFTLSLQYGELELKNALAPAAQVNDMIIVSDAANTPILTGVLK
jgi:hypothetical protein